MKQEIKEKYLKNPNTCPYCGSENLEISGSENYDDYKEDYIICNNCNEEWTDIYTLTDAIIE